MTKLLANNLCIEKSKEKCRENILDLGLCVPYCAECRYKCICNEPYWHEDDNECVYAKENRNKFSLLHYFNGQ